MAPALLMVAATLIYVVFVIFPRVAKREKSRHEQRQRRFRNRLMAVARPEDDDDQESR